LTVHCALALSERIRLAPACSFVFHEAETTTRSSPVEHFGALEELSVRRPRHERGDVSIHHVSEHALYQVHGRADVEVDDLELVLRLPLTRASSV
jgi:hypothetical protein